MRLRRLMAPVVIAFLLAVYPDREAAGTGGCGEDCAKCHSLSAAEAAAALQSFSGNLRVTGVQMSPIRGLWEVHTETAAGKKGAIYLSFSLKQAVEGTIFELDSKEVRGSRTPSTIGRVNPSTLPLKSALTLGNPVAKNRVIVFTDPECPYCLKLHEELKKVVSQRKDIAFSILLFPLPIHPQAYRKALAIQCKKSLELLEDSLNGKKVPAAECRTPAVDDNIRLADKLGITGTPTLIMPGGTIVFGYQPAKVIIEMVGKL